MTDKCPTCERDFQRLKDYPVIHIVRFSRVEEPIINQPQVQEALSALEGYVGQEVLTRELLALPAFRGEIKTGDYNDLALSFYEAGQTEDGLRTCRINLNADWHGRVASHPSLSQDVAKMDYEGRIHR